MNMIYGSSPVRLIDGIAAFKAGEWPGLKPNRFGLTKRVIRPEPRNPMFDDKERPTVFLKKHYHFNETKEWTFKPSLKMVRTANEVSPRNKSIMCYNQTFTQNKVRPERVHMWPFKEIEKENRGLNTATGVIAEKIIKTEMRNIGKVGFSRPNFDQIMKFRKEYKSADQSQILRNKIRSNNEERIFSMDETKANMNFVKTLNERDKIMLKAK